MFNVTYDIVTPESAEDGDAAERGFICKDVGLREAMQHVGGYCEDSGRWFTFPEYDENYRTGGVESRALHPPRKITAASYARLRRVLGINSEQH